MGTAYPCLVIDSISPGPGRIVPLFFAHSALRTLARGGWGRIRRLHPSRIFSFGYRHVRQLWHAPLQRNGCSLSEAYSLLEEACSSPNLAALPPVSPEPEREAPALQDGAPMSRRRAYRNRIDRRQDGITADLVDIGLMFADVFGPYCGESYFRTSVVKPAVYRRVLLGPCRLPMTRDDAGDPASS